MKTLGLRLAILVFPLTIACGASAAIFIPRPPIPRVEIRRVAPGPGFLWVSGQWEWRQNNWAWREGRWSRPVRAGAVWVNGGWNRHRWIAAHWR